MFKFTIRDLLWLTVVVALGMAWWMDRSRANAKYQRVRGAYRELAEWVAHGEWVRLGAKSDLPAFLPNP